MGFSTFATISRLRGRMATDAACGGGVCPERWALLSGAERRDSGGRSGSATHRLYFGRRMLSSRSSRTPAQGSLGSKGCRREQVPCPM